MNFPQTKEEVLEDPTGALNLLFESVRINHGQAALTHVIKQMRETISNAPANGNGGDNGMAFVGMGGGLMPPPPGPNNQRNNLANTYKSKKQQQHDEYIIAFNAAQAALETLLGRESILGEELRKDHILQAAFEDGSSVICNHCNGLIKRDRWGAHVARWVSFFF